MSTRAITLSLSVRDADSVRKELERIGPAGEEAIRRLDAAAQKAAAGGGLSSTSSAARELQGTLSGLASRAGTVGSALASLGPAGLAAGAGLASLSLGASRVAKAGDELVASLNRIRAATGSVEAAREVYEQLYRVSLQTGQSVSESAGQFARFAIAAKEIGATNAQAVQLVDTLQKAAIVGGASMQEASSAATQLAQALASGRLNGDELGSLLENMPNLAVALARELGVGVGELRKLGEEGKLTADRVFPALLRAGQEMNAEYEKMPVTMSRAFDQLTVATTGFLSQLDEALGLSQKLAGAFSGMAAAMNAMRNAIPTAASLAQDRTAQLQGEIGALRDRLRLVAPTGEVSVSATPRRGGISSQLQVIGANNAGSDLTAELRAELAQREKDLADHLNAQINATMDGADRQFKEAEAAAAKAADLQRRRAGTEVDALRKTLDREGAVRREYAETVEKLNKGVSTGAITAAEGERLIASATRERDEALKKLGETATRTGRRLADAGFRVDVQDADGGNFTRDSGVQRRLDAWRKDAEQKAAAEEKVEASAREKAAAEYRKFEEGRENEAARATDNIVRYSGDALADMISSTEGGWARAWQNMGRVALATAARIGAEMVFRPVISPIVSAAYGAGTAGGVADAGGSSGLGVLSSASSLYRSASNYGGFSTGIGAVDGVLGQTLWGTGQQIAGPLSAANPMGAVYSGSTTTLGGLLGGAGAGFAAGTLLNSLVGGKSTGGMVGSGGGALAGAALGSIVPGVGTLLGGLIGGGAGGLLGGMFGSNPQSPASSVQIGIGPDGQLTIMGDRSKGMSSAEGIAAAQQTIAGLNQRVAASGLSLRQSNGAVAQTHQGKDARPGADAEEMTRVVLGSLQGGSAAVTTIIARELAKGAAASIDKAFADIDWTRTVYEPLSRTTPAVSEFEQAIDALNVTYGNAIQKASELGLATTDLAANMSKAIQEATAARDAQYRQTSDTLIARAMRGRGDDMGADLLMFDVGASQERSALEAQLRAQGATGEAYASQMARLEEALWLERRQIAERGADALVQASEQAQRSATQSALGVITSLADYSRSLAVGSDSPLSAQEQYGIAERQFNAVSGAAVAGDARSLSSLQGYAQTYLQASRSLYGSTSGYAQAYDRVQNALGQVGDLGMDTLTASFYAQQTQDLKTSLVQELQTLQAQFAAMRLELRQVASGRALAA